MLSSLDPLLLTDVVCPLDEAIVDKESDARRLWARNVSHKVLNATQASITSCLIWKIATNFRFFIRHSSQNRRFGIDVLLLISSPK